jgi:acyl-CoA thioesterase-1
MPECRGESFAFLQPIGGGPLLTFFRAKGKVSQNLHTREDAAMSFLPFPAFLSNLCSGSDLPPAARRPLRILAFGDSLVAGFAVSSKKAFPVRLEKTLQAMGFSVELINAGLPGDTTAGGLSRLEGALGCDPDLVILELGTNDNLQGFDPALTEANLDAMLTRIKKRGIAVLLTGIRPLRDLGDDYRVAFTTIFPRLAEKHEAPLYLDFLEGVAGRPELNKADGIHPNPKGIDEIVRRISPLVGETLKKLDRR